MPKQTDSFEKDLQALETLVETLEKGDLTLDQSLKQFEKGINLSLRCQTALDKAEQKVKILMQKDPNATPENFDNDTGND